MQGIPKGDSAHATYETGFMSKASWLLPDMVWNNSTTSQTFSVGSVVQKELTVKTWGQKGWESILYELCPWELEMRLSANTRRRQSVERPVDLCCSESWGLTLPSGLSGITYILHQGTDQYVRYMWTFLTLGTAHPNSSQVTQRAQVIHWFQLLVILFKTVPHILYLLNIKFHEEKSQWIWFENWTGKIPLS